MAETSKKWGNNFWKKPSTLPDPFNYVETFKDVNNTFTSEITKKPPVDRNLSTVSVLVKKNEISDSKGQEMLDTQYGLGFFF